MQIFIPTRDRLNAQFTWQNLTPELRAVTRLVCPAEEVEAHQNAQRNAVARPPVRLAAVRQWLVEELCNPDEPVIMLDDDLDFFVRKNPDAYNLTPARGDRQNELFQRLHDLVDSEEFAHAGLSPRQMNNQHFPATTRQTMRMNAVHCVDPRVLKRENVRYDDVDMMEDYHVTLSLFRLGYDNSVIVDGAWDQTKGSGAPGGFSHYRTGQTQSAAAYRLQELHPQFVTVVKKAPKTGAGDFAGERDDVRVQWRKAYSAAPIKR